MTRDATYEEGAEQPLRLRAVDSDDLTVISTLVQDSVLPATEMQWLQSDRRFALLLNRFRWEDRENATKYGRPPERVQSILLVDEIEKVAFSGIDPRDKDQVLSVLSLEFSAGNAPSGVLTVNFAGDGALALTVECLEVMIKDVTRPYVSPSQSEPKHLLDED